MVYAGCVKVSLRGVHCGDTLTHPAQTQSTNLETPITTTPTPPDIYPLICPRCNAQTNHATRKLTTPTRWATLPCHTCGAMRSSITWCCPCQPPIPWHHCPTHRPQGFLCHAPARTARTNPHHAIQTTGQLGTRRRLHAPLHTPLQRKRPRTQNTNTQPKRQPPSAHPDAPDIKRTKATPYVPPPPG
jgi:hypothetical protein